MSKNIKINYNDTVYTLEFTKATVKLLEKSGFVLDEIGDKPVTLIPMLWSGSFLANHPKVSSGIKDEIFENMNSKDELVLKLMELYEDTVNGLLADSGDPKNSSWEASW